MTTIDRVVLDFDGTCTLVPEIEAAYLSEYFRLLRAEVLPTLTEARWEEQLQALREASPGVGWMLGGAAPSAPASADPYMLAGEAATRLVAAIAPDRAAGSSLHHRAYDKAQAPFRPETARILGELVALDLQVTFVSNSSSAKIQNRLDDLLAGDRAVRERIGVESDAAKFSIREIALEAAVPPSFRAKFGELPAGDLEPTTGRPIYLRRGRYFEALCKVWGPDPAAIGRTIVCGDVWELDLAMPAALGCAVHLIARHGAHPTYGYERARAERHGAVSEDLTGLLARIRALRAEDEIARVGLAAVGAARRVLGCATLSWRGHRDRWVASRWRTGRPRATLLRRWKRRRTRPIVPGPTSPESSVSAAPYATCSDVAPREPRCSVRSRRTLTRRARARSSTSGDSV